jgi:hypothetical protein
MRSLIHPFVPSARATSPRNPAKSAQQFFCRTEANCRPRTLLPNSSEETFLLPDGFLTALDPQVRLLALPNFGVNNSICYTRPATVTTICYHTIKCYYLVAWFQVTIWCYALNLNLHAAGQFPLISSFLYICKVYFSSLSYCKSVHSSLVCLFGANKPVTN